jgi:hypothetical protein
MPPPPQKKKKKKKKKKNKKKTSQHPARGVTAPRQEMRICARFAAGNRLLLARNVVYTHKTSRHGVCMLRAPRANSPGVLGRCRLSERD